MFLWDRLNYRCIFLQITQKLYLQKWVQNNSQIRSDIKNEMRKDYSILSPFWSTGWELIFTFNILHLCFTILNKIMLPSFHKVKTINKKSSAYTFLYFLMSSHWSHCMPKDDKKLVLFYFNKKFKKLTEDS